MGRPEGTPPEEQPPDGEGGLGIEAIAALFIAISLFMPLLPFVAEFAIVSLFVIPWLLMGALPFVAVALVIASVFRSDDSEWDPQEGYVGADESEAEDATTDQTGSSPIGTDTTDTQSRTDDPPDQPRGDPLEILKERFATGEITIDEYERGLELLVDVDDPSEGLRRVRWLDDDEIDIFDTDRLADDPFEYVDDPEQIERRVDAAKRKQAGANTATPTGDNDRSESRTDGDADLSNEQLDAIAEQVVERLEQERERKRERN